jgi:uncharacterized repeat protein (TIGR03803 family)
MSSSRRSITTFLVLAFAAVLCIVVTTASQLHAQIYTDVHEFNCAIEGCSPTYPEVLAQGRDGNLYGTTDSGGTSGMGTVFMVTTSGTLTTLHNFLGLDGQNPDGGLVLGSDGNFYGTTRFGGASNLGTVFKITPAGVLTTLHSFSGTDGSEPRPGLVQGKSGAFYGTTCGFNPPWTAYSITSTGVFKAINATNDVRIATCSSAPLILGNDGNLYGTTMAGGVTETGTVFRMSPAGVLKTIFTGDFAHGTNLAAPVVQGSDGFLYGAAVAGGSGTFGVLFKLSTAGKYTILHEFGLDLIHDGMYPYSGLVAASDGKFYGATSAGSGSGSVQNGNLFSVTSSGSYNMLYAFDYLHGYLDQATPMQHTNGRIYGVAEGGGPNFNSGVLYSLDNGALPFVHLMTKWGTTGQTVGILGSGLTGTSAVKFGSGSASFTVVSDSYVTAVVPPGGTAGFVTVTTPSGTFTSNQKFNVVPTITGIAPGSGPVGSQVSITGAALLGASVVKFGGVKATSFTVNSGTSITATVPTGALTGKVLVTTAGGTASSKTVFTVTP